MKQKPEKIGILTYTSNFNFGTFFQAYATLCSLRHVFPDAQVEIVNCNSATKYTQMGYERLNLKKRHLYPPNLFTHLRKQSEYRKFQKQYLEIDSSAGFFSDSYEATAAYIQQQSYDLLVVGSDTVLNFYDWNFRQGELPIYWLPQDLPMKKVMVSSSIGTDLKISDFVADELDSLRKSVTGFNLIGVRDPITYSFISELDSSVTPIMQTMPDPTFSFNHDVSYAEAYLAKHNIDKTTPLIGLDLPLSIPGLEKALQYYKSKGYKIASWRGSSALMDYDFSDMNPFQWSGIFNRFSLTLTNRFHASIFSFKNLTPVIAIDYKSNRVASSMQSKVSLLLDSFEMKQDCYRNIKSLTDDNWMLDTMGSLLDSPPIESIEQGLATLRSEYYSYLNRVQDLFLHDVAIPEQVDEETSPSSDK